MRSMSRDTAAKLLMVTGVGVWTAGAIVAFGTGIGLVTFGVLLVVLALLLGWRS